MARHPTIRVDLILDERQEDLVTEGIDVALRFGPLSSTSTLP
jgi:DNA-binding transcriptional LysR family regulator